MAGDLNEFLRQAAMRREARKRQTGSQGAPTSQSQNAPAQSRPVAQSSAEVLQPIPVDQRHLLPGIPAGDHLGGNAAKTDQKREAHIREVFGTKPAPLENQKKRKPRVEQQVAPQPQTAAQMDFASALNSLTASQSGQRSVSSHDLIAFLRNPDSLKIAFIASEIFSRKFQ